MNKNIGIGLVIALLIIAAGVFAYQKNQTDQSMMMDKEKDAMVKDDAMMDDKKDAMMEDGKMMSGYSGKILAGKSAPFLEFNQADYDKALKEGKVIVLNFYANWCPICRAEAPELDKGFNTLTSDKVVGFRVNFKDSETDENETKLAEQFEVPYQHYKVILKSGKPVLKSGDQWDSKTLIDEVTKALQ